MPGWSVHEDGSFTLATHGISIRNAYPAIDGQAVRPLGVAIETTQAGGTISYRLSAGATLELELTHDEGAFLLRTVVRGMPVAPQRIAPIGAAQVEGADQVFVQGLGFGGPSGFHDLALAPAASPPAPPPAPEQALWESYGLCGLVAPDDQALVIGACDHRRYLCKATLARRREHRGLVNRHLETQVFELGCSFATEGCAWSRIERLPDVRLLGGPRAWDALRSFAGTVGSLMGARAPARPTYHWCSWYRRGCHFDRADLDRLLEWLANADPRVPFQAIQIDDGYCIAAGDWLEANAQWPGGLAAAFAAIATAGYRPGVWIAPFMVGSRSRLFREHPDWVIRDRRGRPLAEWTNYGNSAIAAHHDEETYALDTSHPAAMAYLREVFATLRGWGCRFFKTDFMDWGLKDSAAVARHTPGKTSVEHFREVLSMIRDAIGEDSHWLGCIMPFAPSIGAVDSMRIANDAGPAWSEGGTGNMVAESVADQYFNNVWWQNDSDSVVLRDRFVHLEEGEVKALAYWQGVLGSSVSTSEYLQELPAERLNLWYFLEPDDRPWTAILPGWNRQKRLRVAAREFRGLDAWAVVVLNPGNQTATEVLKLSDLGIDSAYAFAWEPGRARRLGKLDALASEVGPRQAQLYFLSQWGEPPPPDLSLGGKLLSYWLIGYAQ